MSISILFFFFCCFYSLQQIAAKMKGILLINASQQDDINQDTVTASDTDLLFHQQQKSLQQNLQFEQSMMKEREQRVRQIEEDVLDVNQIMRELSTLINQQSENIGKYYNDLPSHDILEISFNFIAFNSFYSHRYN